MRQALVRLAALAAAAMLFTAPGVAASEVEPASAATPASAPAPARWVHAYAAFTSRDSSGGGSAPALAGLLNHHGGSGLAGVVTGGVGLAWDPLARLEEGHRLVLLEQVQAWCRDTHTTVTAASAS